MLAGEIVYFPYKDGFVRYKIRKIMDDDLLVLTYKSNISNCVPISEVLTTEQFAKTYKNEIIYE